MSVLHWEFELYGANMNKNGSIVPDKEPRQQVDVPQQLLLFIALHTLSLLGKIGQILPGLSFRVDKIESCRHLIRRTGNSDSMHRNMIIFTRPVFC